MAPATTTATAEYELVLMIDPEVSDERRDQIAADARKRIESGGSLKHEAAWGMRNMAFEIRQRNEADYRFFRFETVGPLLDELNHNLRIADGVLRFRIFRVDPRSPVIAPPAPTAAAGAPPRGRPEVPSPDAAEEAVADEVVADEAVPEEAVPVTQPPTAEEAEGDAAPATESVPEPESPSEPAPKTPNDAAPESASEQPPTE
jgi:small subunit ribosomal protein S6